MADILETFIKLALPIILAIVAIVSACKGLFITKRAIFEEREKLSKLSYDLYKINEDKELKRLSVEYGYAAITKDNFLNLEQRRALVRSENPTRDIDLFIKCRGLLDIKAEPLSFFWKKKRYSNVIYFTLAVIFRIIFYALGAFLLILPVFYSVLLPSFMLEKIAGFSALAKIGLTLYIIITGVFLAYVNLSSATRMIDSAKLIKRHEII
ncbi:UNVERIFIED_ORG: hypothetical protein J2Y78_003528 [Buttiauxella agrestis ATCC 33320]